MKTFFVLLFATVIAVISQQSLMAQSLQIPYQGYIAEKSGKAYNGTFQFEFAIVLGSSGLPSWNSGSLSIPVKDGIYSVVLGNTGQPALNSSLFVNSNDTRLRISFDDGVKGHETLSPDVQFLPVPYAVRAKYADTSFVQTSLPPMDSLVLRDKRGVVRMVMNPNTGTFKMMNNDTTWYSLAVNSPPTETINWGNKTTEKTTYPNGDHVETTRDSYTGKLINTKTETTAPDGTKTVVYRDYIGGELERETIITTNPTTLTETRKEIWYYWWSGAKRSERTTVNGVTVEEKYYDDNGNVTYQKTDSIVKKSEKETYYGSNGIPWLSIEKVTTPEGTTTTRTGYDENGQPKYESTEHSNGKYEYKDLKKGDSSSGEPGKSTEKSGNSSTTTEGGSIHFEAGTTGGFGMGIDPNTGEGGLWYGTTPNDSTTVGLSATGITIETPKAVVESKETKLQDPKNPTSGGIKFDFNGSSSGNSVPKFEFKRSGPSNFGQRSTLEWNPQNNFGITVSDTGSGKSTGILWDPINGSVNSINDFTIGGSAKSDTIKPRSKSTVSFGSGITVNGQSNFSNTIDIAGAAQIQQNGTFTGTAAVVQNATVNQQLRTNQILPVSPSTTVTINGNLNVIGNLTKGGGNFKIDHPLDPYNKYLIHSFVESPDRTNIYSGNVITDVSGMGVVRLPYYFEAANNDFRYQLTVIGADARSYVATEISQNTFTVQTSIPNVKVSWQVTSTRTDAFAKSNRYDPEQEKELEMKGKLLYPIQE
ncbi:MAG: hypothetical protein HYZ54_06550 [Ignavibacteriae bacterium]|nr:hypothetical protein [Ignavibacteriota bacterium]